jgi:hypothetical protein
MLRSFRGERVYSGHYFHEHPREKREESGTKENGKEIRKELFHRM